MLNNFDFITAMIVDCGLWPIFSRLLIWEIFFICVTSLQHHHVIDVYHMHARLCLDSDEGQKFLFGTLNVVIGAINCLFHSLLVALCVNLDERMGDPSLLVTLLFSPFPLFTHPSLTTPSPIQYYYIPSLNPFRTLLCTLLTFPPIPTMSFLTPLLSYQFLQNRRPA